MSHEPALDGMRGAAVAGVVAFHLGHLSGGFLGVDLFFTLSGYLITRLLLIERDGTGRVDLGGFWSRRAWRLLPALFLVLAAVAIYAWVGARPDELEGIRGGGLSSLAYVANWYFLATGDDYWNLFIAPTPLDHLWSLAIEEQFYLVWPVVFIGLAGARGERRLVVVTAAATVATAGYMAFADPADAYLNTLTRSSSILLGALLGIAIHRESTWIRRTLAGASGRALSTASVLFLVASWIVVDGSADEAFFRGGFLAHALAVVVLIGRVTVAPDDLEGRLLSIRPLRVLGVVSYGLYLWHWPVLIVVDLERTGTSGTSLLLLRLAVMAALTAASYLLIERPARAEWSRVPRAIWSLPIAAGVTAVLLVLGTRLPETPPVVGAIPTEPAITLDRPPVEAAEAGPVRVLLIGDSYLFDIEPAVDAAVGSVPGIDVRPGARFAFAVSDDSSLDVLAAARDEHQPDLIITMFARFDQDWLDDRDRSANARAELEDRLVEALDILGAPTERTDGASIVVIGLAPSLTPGLDRVPLDRTINDVFRAAVARVDHAEFLDPDPVVAPAGEPERWVTVGEAELQMRKADVSHYCADGAARWGQAIGALIASLTGSEPTEPAEWWAGEWRDDPRYDEPSGACAP